MASPTLAAVTPSRNAGPPRLDELPLPMRLLLAITRLANHEGTLPVLSRQILDSFGYVLDAGPDRLHTLAAVNDLDRTVLAQTWRRLDIGSGPATLLSADEHLVVEALSRVKDGGDARHDPALARIMGAEARERFGQAAAHVLSVVTAPAASAHANSERDMSSASPLATPVERSVLECRDLSLPEAVALALVRLWVRGTTTGFDSIAAVRLSCAHLAVPRLGEAVATILHRASRDAHRRIDVRCLCCPELSPDEARLLGGLSALGGGFLHEYLEHLHEWLPPASANSVFALTADHGTFDDLGTPLPVRDWDFELLLARQPLFDSIDDRAASTVH